MAGQSVDGDRIVRRKLSDEVFDRLYRQIETGAFPTGSQLPSERELMTQFGVGRPAVREAMQTLERLGLIAITHGERARVVQPTAEGMFGQIDHAARHLLASSPRSLEQLKEAREFFEVGMAAEAARRAGPDDIALLQAAHARHESLLGGDPAAFVAADMDFHMAIAGITGNAVFSAVSSAMLAWLSRFHSGILHWKGHEPVTLAEHRQILDAVAAKDPEAASAAMRHHLRRTRGVYRQEGAEEAGGQEAGSAEVVGSA